MAKPIRKSRVREVALSEIKDDLSRFLREAEKQAIVITRHGKPAGVLIGFEQKRIGSSISWKPIPRSSNESKKHVPTSVPSGVFAWRMWIQSEGAGGPSQEYRHVPRVLAQVPCGPTFSYSDPDLSAVALRGGAGRARIHE
jgi:prevent-host-death family protein